MPGSDACAKIRTSPDRRRRKVLDVARDLFRTQGFHGTGIAQISKAAGIHVAQLYRDFGSKEAIIAAIVEEEVQSSFDQAGEVAVMADEPDGFRAWIRANLERVITSDHISLFTEVIAEASRNPAIATVLQDIDARVRRHMTKMFAHAAPAAHGPASTAVLADLFIVLVSGLQLRLVAHPDLDRNAMIDRVAAIIEAELLGKYRNSPDGTIP